MYRMDWYSYRNDMIKWGILLGVCAALLFWSFEATINVQRDTTNAITLMVIALMILTYKSFGFFKAYYNKDYYSSKVARLNTFIHLSLFAILLTLTIIRINNHYNLQETFDKAFDATIKTSGIKAPKINYNGTGKAISADFTPWSDKVSFEYNGKFIPESLKTLKPEDIKYIVIVKSIKDRGRIGLDYDVEIIELYPWRSLSEKTFKGKDAYTPGKKVISISGRFKRNLPSVIEVKNWVENIITKELIAPHTEK